MIYHNGEMIRVCYVIDTINSPTAGTEIQLLRLIKHLNKDHFHPYLCILHSSPWLKESFQDCEVFDIGFGSFSDAYSYSAIVRFVNFLRQQKIAIVQTYFVDGNKVGVVAASLAGIPIVISCRRNQGFWHTRLERLVLKLLNHMVTMFVANSNSTRQWSIEHEGLAPEKITVIRNSIEPAAFQPPSLQRRQSARFKLGIPMDVSVVGIVANLRQVKGIEVFLKAASIVHKRLPSSRFLVVGSGPLRQSLEYQAKELELGKCVLFLGGCKNVPEILPAIDVGVLASFSESSSNALLEYLASGLPIVSTDVGDVKEMVENGRDGFIVPVGDYNSLADRIVHILTGGLDRVERTCVNHLPFLLPETMTKAYEALYVTLLQQYPSLCQYD